MGLDSKVVTDDWFAEHTYITHTVDQMPQDCIPSAPVLSIFRASMLPAGGGAGTMASTVREKYGCGRKPERQGEHRQSMFCVGTES